MRTNEEELILWGKLGDENGKPVTEFEHEGRFFKHRDEYICKKCGLAYKGLDPQISCPIPDSYPGSDEKIAEKIKQYLAKRFQHGDKKISWLFNAMLKKEYANSPVNCQMDYTTWLEIKIKPRQKITAFLNIFKKEQSK